MLVSHLTNSKKQSWKKKIQEKFLPLEGVQNCLGSKHARTVQLTSGATASMAAVHFFLTAWQGQIQSGFGGGGGNLERPP